MCRTLSSEPYPLKGLGRVIVPHGEKENYTLLKQHKREYVELVLGGYTKKKKKKKTSAGITISRGQGAT